MARYFISQPMRNIPEDEIREEREAIASIIKDCDPDAEIVPMLSSDIRANNSNLTCLGMSITELGKCDLAIFAKNWWEAGGCFIEHACCKEYGIPHVDIMFKAASHERHGIDRMIEMAIGDILQGKAVQ